MLDELISRHHANNAGFCRHYMTLYSIVLGMEAKNVFEFGSGFSSKAILMALKETGGKLITCDYRPLDKTGIFYDLDDNFMREMSNKWRYINKRSSAALKDIDGEFFDVVLHDGSHKWEEVAEDLRTIIPHVKGGGMILVHDTAHPTENFQLKKAINAMDWAHGGEFCIERLTLPYGYGLTLIRLLDDFGNGQVEIQWKKQQ